MGRLTRKDKNGNWNLKGMPWERRRLWHRPGIWYIILAWWWERRKNSGQ